MGGAVSAGAATLPQPGGKAKLIVADCGIDACWVSNYDGGVLIVSPNQTFACAAAAVARVAPHLHTDEVRAMLREKLPRMDMNIDVVLPGYSMRHLNRQAEQEGRSTRGWLMAMVVLLGVLVLVVLLALGSASATA